MCFSDDNCFINTDVQFNRSWRELARDVIILIISFSRMKEDNPKFNNKTVIKGDLFRPQLRTGFKEILSGVLVSFEEKSFLKSSKRTSYPKVFNPFFLAVVNDYLWPVSKKLEECRSGQHKVESSSLNSLSSEPILNRSFIYKSLLNPKDFRDGCILEKNFEAYSPMNQFDN